MLVHMYSYARLFALLVSLFDKVHNGTIDNNALSPQLRVSNIVYALLCL